MKIYKKVLILVMSSCHPEYAALEDSIKETWYNYRNDDVEIIFYKGSGSTHFDNVNLYLECVDDFNGLGQKTLLAFDFVLQNFDFEYIYRSNLGAFVDVTKLLSFLKDKPKDSFYCGVIGTDTYYFNKEVKFASGSGYFLSKDLVKLVSDNKHLWPHHAVDDVALGYLMSLLDIEIDTSAVRKNVCNNSISYNLASELVDEIDEQYLYHIRLRSDDRSIDIENMKNIYKNKNITND